VHVDGAFGLWAATSQHRKHLMLGIGRADSWATDAHKWLNVPQDSGVALVRESEVLQRAMSITAAYYPDPAAKREPMTWGPESSRRLARYRNLGGVCVFWVRKGWKISSREPVAMRPAFADGLRAAGFEVLNDVVLNQGSCVFW